MAFLFLALSGALFFALAVMTSVEALTITNRGIATQELTIDDGDAIQSLVLQPQQTADKVCEKGCMIRLPNGDEADFEGTELVEFDEDGFIFKD